MNKRATIKDTNEDVIRMNEEFEAQRAKNPQWRASAFCERIGKSSKKSIFAKSRVKEEESDVTRTVSSSNDEITNELLGEIHEKIVGDVRGDKSIHNLVLGDIVENHFNAPKVTTDSPNLTSKRLSSNKSSKSIFARNFAAGEMQPPKIPKMESTTNVKLSERFGTTSAIVEEKKTADEVHAHNLEILSQMREEEILAERQNLLNSVDPNLIALLIKKRQAKATVVATAQPKTILLQTESTEMEMEKTPSSVIEDLSDTNPAHELLHRANQENWLNFDVVEKDKLDWMRDIPAIQQKLKPGEKFEARFDWKGVLLPFTIQEIKTKEELKSLRDERELYLHGEEPARPGYTLQELFRLARSSVLQQRISAFGAVAGILNIYNQGFYDQVLDLPISKIFFLLRFGLDDNMPSQLEVVSKALAYLFYNETDETTLDYIYDNDDCYWQPMLSIDPSNSNTDDPLAIENLQKEINALNLNSPSISVNVDENEEESRTSMTDFQLAETDLVDCIIRTNIFKRIFFILHNVRPDNSTVVSCLKLLIRLGRSNSKIAEQIINSELLDCLIINFLPSTAHIDTNLQQPPYYNYPQYLFLKLIRVLLSHHLNVALAFKNTPLLERLQNYLFNSENLRSKLIRVQIESLRVLRCLLMQRIIDHKTFKEFLPAFRQMLDWHYNHCVYEVGGPALIRQHAAALLATIASNEGCGAGDLEVQKLLGGPIHNFCCSWLHKATRAESVKEYSQATLLANCLHVMNWYSKHCIDVTRLRDFYTKYLPDFVRSSGFVECIKACTHSSIILHTSSDRRNVHPSLPNVGSVLVNEYGPQLIFTQSYPVHLLCVTWHSMKLQLENGQKALSEALIRPEIIEPLVGFLKMLSTKLNRFMSSNFFARSELRLVFQWLCFDGLEIYLTKSELFQLVFNFVCCLPITNAPEIKKLFERFIFEPTYIDVDANTLQLWLHSSFRLIRDHINENNIEPKLTLPYSQIPALPVDWPYFQLRSILKNYIDNVQRKSSMELSERDILSMTFSFVNQLEACGIQLVTPTEKLMYLMIAFMGPDSEFLDVATHKLLHEHIVKFYAENANTVFDFEKIYAGKCKFENLYALFVEHFQAASYGDELFSSLVLLPMAQKYDNKWRRRLWSDYGGALRYLNCDESLLIGGITSYMEPIEDESSLIMGYKNALIDKIVRPGTIPYRIAKHHFDSNYAKQKFSKTSEIVLN